MARRDAKSRKAARKAERQAAEEAVRRMSRRRRIIAALIPLVTLALSAGFYVGLDDARATGVVLLVGALMWFLYGLGMLGASVPARDRNRAGSIDFGNRG